ncbi:hypothetical protein LCGC14_1080910 [marine sediment metagenome]|uniref:SpoVT-AbrB domain-containing protein n=1 Tax=marine sediment metagenome TaxID=412755 RepID=A0A0F9N2V8_9ZZZZ
MIYTALPPMKENMHLLRVQKYGGSHVIVLPAALAREYGFRPGTFVRVTADGKGRLVIEKLTPETHPQLFVSGE